MVAEKGNRVVADAIREAGRRHGGLTPPPIAKGEVPMSSMKYATAEVDGFKILYREAGRAGAPGLLLLHGFPSGGHMFRDLIPQFADAHGAADATAVSPDGYSLDNFYLARLGADEVQLDLFGDSKTNIALYPAFQQYFRTHKPPLLAVWGRNDPFFLPSGAEAFKRDNPAATVRFFDTGHFTLETHALEIAQSIRDFLVR